MRAGTAVVTMVLVACAKDMPPAPTPATPIPSEAPPAPKAASAPVPPRLPPPIDPGSGCVARGTAHRLRTAALRVPGGPAFGRFYARAKLASLTVVLDESGDAIVTIDEDMVVVRGVVATDDVPIHSKKSTPLAGVVFPTRWTTFRFVANTPEGVKAELPSTMGMPKLDVVIPCGDVTLEPPTALDDPFSIGDADLSFAVRAGKLNVSPSVDAAPTLEFSLERSLAVMTDRARPRKNGRVFTRIETPPPGPVIVGYVPEKSLTRNSKAQFFGDYIPPWVARMPSPLDLEEGTEPVVSRCSAPLPLIARTGRAGDRTIGTVKSGARVTLGETYGEFRRIELPGVFEVGADAMLLVSTAAAAACK